LGDGQWVRGKSLSTFCPIGMDLVTVDEIPDPQDFEIRCVVSGVEMPRPTTALMYHSVAAIISYRSEAFGLLLGDAIATGTPSGVGVFRHPPITLAASDEIAAIGRVTNRCRTDKGS
jgi:2-keto-4-pentenoate hydratase/2-oxohepta-3-ene-1,7-dioic acid hydratase in catechol pathway